ncbi:MAG: hypothetical protein MUC29_01325 [Pyrinomonadaceae bacterium]|jgi:hypothetical protein|nr:hypothetical protein [Pyrinomonadaceae bacterium]
MSEEKLDLILTVVSQLKNKVEGLENEFVSFKNEFVSFKKETREAFINLNTKIEDLNTRLKTIEKKLLSLDKQTLAVAVELKEDIGKVKKEIRHLEEVTMLEQSENLKDRVIIRRLQDKVKIIEEKLNLAA